MFLINEWRAKQLARMTTNGTFTPTQADALFDMILLIRRASPEARHFWQEMLAMREQLEKAGFDEGQRDALLEATMRAFQGEFHR